ncbi:hypothetical protein GGR54DRAFT_621919 [Hypoxylon sp. NC1633]|nr:hypothetical protein GGR54DRAFT_621919 [Hypoxylon sp. NC1633]
MHHHQHHALRSLLPLLLVSPTLGTFFNDGLRGNIDPAVWDAALAAPNATGTYAMRGFNVTGDFSATEIPGWTMTARVATDRETHSGEDPAKAQRYFTGTSISVRAPDGLLRDDQVMLSSNGSRWKVRAYVIDGLRKEVIDKAQNDDGTCSSFLSAECITEWQDSYVKSNGSLQDEPEKCNEELGGSWGVWASEDFVPLTAFNGTELFARAVTGHELNARGSWYEDAVRSIWPVMMVYFSTDAQNVTRNEQARLTCVRATNITPGSQQPKSSAAITLPSGLWMTLGTVAAAAFLTAL